MIDIKGMEHFQELCRKQLVNSYNERYERKINYDDTFIVWACKTLQNYKCLASTMVNGDGIYVEYTYNGNRRELYEDIYRKVKNACITEII